MRCWPVSGANHYSSDGSPHNCSAVHVGEAAGHGGTDLQIVLCYVQLGFILHPGERGVWTCLHAVTEGYHGNSASDHTGIMLDNEQHSLGDWGFSL